MSIDEALQILKRILDRTQLNKVQELVFRHAWEDKSYLEIAAATGYDAGYIKDSGAKLWQLLTDSLGERVTKQNFQGVLRQLLQKQQQESSLSDRPTHTNASLPISQRDWGDAIDTSTFYGRSAELATLEQWILVDRCRWVAVLGMGGIGKTSLTVKLAEQVQGDFEVLVWRSLLNAPPLPELLMDLNRVISGQQEANLTESVGEQISRLLHHLKTKRCLVILDNAETLLQGSEASGQFRPGYEGYGQLLKQIGQVPHRSCLLFTSREKTQELAWLEGINRPVRSLVLQGLDMQAGRQIVTDFGEFTGTREQDWLDLIALYNGNPLALELAAKHIQEIFLGNISDFLTHGKPIFRDLQELLAWHFQRLDAAAWDVLYWLAINREPMSIADLRSDLVLETAKTHLPTTLQSLQRKLPIERSGDRLTLQPVLMEYVTEHLVTVFCAAILQPQLEFVRTYALMKAQSKDYIRQAQVRLITQPVLESLLKTLEGVGHVQQHLKTLITSLQQDAPLQPGYAGGNLLNLLAQMRVDLQGSDFSRLAIWQAYLQDVTLHNVNFIQCQFDRSVFMQSFGGVLAIVFSPNGQLLASSDANGEIHLWQVSDRQRQLTLNGHTNWVRQLTFSADGQHLVSASDDRTLKIWDLCTKTCRTFSGHTDSVYCISISPDGKLIASGSADQTIRIWRSNDGECLQIWQGHAAGILSVQFSPDGHYLASGGFDNTIRVWDVTTGTCLQVLMGHENWVSSVQFSPDGNQLLSGSCDRTLKIWQLPVGNCLSTLSGHTGWIWEAVWSADGRKIASCGTDQTIRLWDHAGNCLHTLQGHRSQVWQVSFHPDGDLVASASEDQTIKLWQVKGGQCVADIRGYTNWVKTIAFSPDGKTLVAGSKDGYSRLWDLECGICLRDMKAHTAGVPTVAFHPDGDRIATGSCDHTVKLWNVQQEQCLFQFNHTNEVWSVAFHPAGRLLASSSIDHTINLWDVILGESVRSLTGHSDRVSCVMFSPQGNLLASSSDDGTIRLWDVLSGECLPVWKEHTARVGSVAFSPDGQLLASASSDQTVKVWNVCTGQCLYTLTRHTSWVMSVAFSPDGSTIASGSCDQTIKLWNVQEGTCINSLKGHANWVWCVAFSPDGAILASASEDETVRLWDWRTGLCLRSLRARRPYEGMNVARRAV